MTTLQVFTGLNGRAKAGAGVGVFGVMVSVKCAFNIYGHIMKCWAAIKTVNYLILFLFPLRFRFCVFPSNQVVCQVHAGGTIYMNLLTLAF